MKKLLITIAIIGITGSLGMVNGTPAVEAMPGRNAQIHQRMDPGRHKGNRPKMTKSQQICRFDYEMSQAVPNLSERQQRRIHRLNRKYIRTARGTYDKSVKKVLDDKQFGQYKVYEKHKMMMMNHRGNKSRMMSESGMVNRMDNNIARAVKSLNDSQIKAIHELNSGFVANREKMRVQMRHEGNAIKGKMHTQMTKARKDYETSLKSILSSGQYQQYESFQKIQRTKGSDKGLKGGYNKD